MSEVLEIKIDESLSLSHGTTADVEAVEQNIRKWLPEDQDFTSSEDPWRQPEDAFLSHRMTITVGKFNETHDFLMDPATDQLDALRRHRWQVLSALYRTLRRRDATEEQMEQADLIFPEFEQRPTGDPATPAH